jgi:hypothetical protein
MKRKAALLVLRVFRQGFSLDRVCHGVALGCERVEIFDQLGIVAVAGDTQRLLSLLPVVGGVCHGITAWIRRERAALSVTDDCRGRIDDAYNSNPYVGLPTLLILASGYRVGPGCGIRAGFRRVGTLTGLSLRDLPSASSFRDCNHRNTGIPQPEVDSGKDPNQNEQRIAGGATTGAVRY